MADEELDLNHDGVVTGDASFGVRKDIALKLKPSPSKGRRGRKPGKHKKEEPREEPSRRAQGEYEDEEVQLPTMKGPSEPQHRNKKLRWDHKVHLIGEKVLDPLIHCCESCTLPILIYGRMIPCKHVFCFDCAKKEEKACPRCHDNVVRIEQAALGTVFVCTHGGAKHGVSGCRRTYLSSRDLQAHIQYRHLREQSQQPQQQQPTTGALPPPQQLVVSQPAMLPHQRQPDYPPVQHNTGNNPAAMVGMTNLPPAQIGQSQQPPPPQLGGNRPVVYHGTQESVQQTQHMQPLSLPQTFTSPPPPTPVQGGTMAQGIPTQQPQVVLPPQGYSQPPPIIQSYHTAALSVMAPGGQQQPPPAGRTSNLISIPMQQQEQNRGGYSAVASQQQGPPPMSQQQPPLNYPHPPTNVGPPPPRGYPPPVSFGGHVGGPPPPQRGGGGGLPATGHLAAGLPPPVSSAHSGGMTHRFPGPAGQHSQAGGGPPGGSVPPRGWQGPPPPRPPGPPPCGPGGGQQPRY